MIISPPLLKNKNAQETESAWLERMMAVNSLRNFPVNASGSWHAGIHIKNTASGAKSEKIRAIADGTVISFRKPSSLEKRKAAPLNYGGETDDGYVLLKHETEIGSGENGKVIFYSLYIHLKMLEKNIKTDAKIYRKDPLGSSGVSSGQNEFHFQIFCDDENIAKLVGRTTQKLDTSRNGRTDAVYGDIHFYVPAGTTFYDKRPAQNVSATAGMTEVYTSTSPLYVSMTLEKGACTMVTRQENAAVRGRFDFVGTALVNADGADYEYNLYKTAMKNYKQSPSAGFELLRFGRIINTEHEMLVPADAPLWMTINYPGGKGVVNLAVAAVKKFSDADFPHWTGWQLVDDDADTDSQCSSAIIKQLQDDGLYEDSKGKLICKFPFEWDKSTFDTRFSWLKSGNDSVEPVSEESYQRLKDHAEALSFNSEVIGFSGLWHFEPKSFIQHYRKCGWLDLDTINRVMTANTKSKLMKGRITSNSVKYYSAINIIMNKYNLLDKNRSCHFLGQGAVESGYLLSMQEVSQEQEINNGIQIGKLIVEASRFNENDELGHWYGYLRSEKDEYYSGNKYNSKGILITGSYSWKNGNCGDLDAQKFRGRGFKMLTGLDTYSSYWVYRGWLSTKDFDSSWWTDPQYKKKNFNKMKKRPPNIASPQDITKNPYNCIDTGGFFIACFKGKVIRIIDMDMPSTLDDDQIIEKVTRGINGANKGIAQRKAATKKSKEILNDEIK